MREKDSNETTPVSVAVLGTGTMGSAMARRLLGAGMSVAVWDRTEEHTERLRADGAQGFRDAHDAVASARIVITTLPTAQAVAELMVESGAIDSLASGAVWAQMGTIGVAETGQLDALVRSRRPEAYFVDAPVSGSRQPAEEGELLVLASGPDDARSIVEPVFSILGKRTLWLGQAGLGTRLKLVLNTWLALQVEAAVESAALAGQLGVSGDALMDALTGSPLASGLSLAKLAKIQANDLSADFALQWALKDLDLVAAAVGTAHVPIAHAIAERWRALVEQGFGNLDVSAAALGIGAQELTSK